MLKTARWKVPTGPLQSLNKNSLTKTQYGQFNN